MRQTKKAALKPGITCTAYATVLFKMYLFGLTSKKMSLFPQRCLHMSTGVHQDTTIGNSNTVEDICRIIEDRHLVHTCYKSVFYLKHFFQYVSNCEIVKPRFGLQLLFGIVYVTWGAHLSLFYREVQTYQSRDQGRYQLVIEWSSKALGTSQYALGFPLQYLCQHAATDSSSSVLVRYLLQTYLMFLVTPRITSGSSSRVTDSARCQKTYSDN